MDEESRPTGHGGSCENELGKERSESIAGISLTVDEDGGSANKSAHNLREIVAEDTSKQAERGDSMPDEGIPSSVDEDCRSANESAHSHSEIVAEDTSEQAECVESKPDKELQKKQFQKEITLSKSKTIVTKDCQTKSLDRQDMGKLSPSRGVSSTEVPGTSARRPVLTNEETLQLLKLQEQTGSFSYYVLNDGEIHLHAEDEKVRQGLDSLKASFLELFGINGDKMKVSVTGRSFNGYFSANKIGAKLEVGSDVQTVGMYLNHCNVLYWVTSAHNLSLRRDQPVKQSSPRAFKHGETGVVFCLSDEQKVPARLVYYTFATKDAIGLRGRHVLHTVDIALGPVLTFPSLVNSGKPVYTSTIQEGHDPCPDCGRAVDECDRNDHLKVECRYRISKFYDMGEKVAGTDERLYSYYKYELINGKGLLVRCQPCGRKVLAGRVVSCENRVIIHDHLSVKYDALNVLLIKPENIREEPQAGDSGSVWVIHDTHEALAITIGRGEFDRDNCYYPVWVASLLRPSLEAFFIDHHSEFADDGKFEPNIGQATSDRLAKNCKFDD